MDLRRALAAVTLIAAGGMLAAPTPAVAGKPLSIDAARQHAKLYANELCAADDSCKKWEIKKCVRLGKSKVSCRILATRKADKCRYPVTVKRKSNGDLTGRVGEVACR